jgi:SNF2 family DNA or RNA helicase
MNLDVLDLDLPFPLRPYQEDGVKFLSKSTSALLADDMGLGKTVQSIVALKKKYKEEGLFRCLIVVPNSLIANWNNEFKTWFPEAHVLTLEGDAQNRLIQLERTTGFLLSSYDQIRIAFSQPNRVKKFDVVVLDEVQKIKNSNSRTTLSCNLIKKDSAWIMSGTPLENNSKEILSVFSFIKSGYIDKDMSNLEIKNMIAPYMLRRLKKDILKELPDLIEQDFYINLTSAQRAEYNKVYENRKSDNPLSVVTKLKQICNFSEDGSSSKLDRLKEIIEELEFRGEKIIVFSQYVKSLEKIFNNIESKNKFIYHGGFDKKEKTKVLNDFKESNGSAVLLMSLQAGAVGLNLQEASTVVLFDRWWTPAVENQAIARAHRMGRTEPVHAIKFLINDSIEERIHELLIEKEDLFEDIVEGAVSIRNKIKLEEILDL